MKKKLYKSRTNSMICGVCGGIGEFFDIDPTIVRVIVLLFGCTSTGILFYLAASFLIPYEY